MVSHMNKELNVFNTWLFTWTKY